MLMARSRLAFAILFLLSGLAALTAQTPDLSQASLEELMNIKVYTASRYLQSTQTAPSLVTVVTADQIQKYGYRTLADILRSVGGFYVTYDRNYSYVGARGFARPGDYNTRILILVDGHRWNENIYDAAYVGTEFVLDVDLIDHVELIRGPSSSLYGADAFFGVVNVITRRGTDLDGAELSTAAASFDSYQGRATYGHQFGSLELLLSTTYFTSGGQNLYYPEFAALSPNNGIAQNADYDGSRTWFTALSYREFILRAGSVSREKGMPTAAFGNLFNDPNIRTVDAHHYADLRYDKPLHRDGALSARLYYDRISYDGHYRWYPVEGAPPVPFSDWARGELVGGELILQGPLWHRHHLSAGMEFRKNLRQDQGSFDVQPFTMYLDDHRSSYLWAGFVQDEVALTSKFTLSAGLRHDQYSTFGGTTNPRLGFIYRPREATTLKFLYGTAFRAPSNYELYYHNHMFMQNPALQPETIRTFEVVAEQSLAPHLRLAISGYHNRIHGLITETEPVPYTYMYANLGRVQSKGAELELTARWLSGVEGRASYNLQRTADRSSGLALGNSPVHLAKLGLIVPLMRNQLFASLDSWYMSRRRTLTGSSTGGFAVFNATLFSRNLGRHADVSASLYNLFDKNYSDPGAEEHIQNALRQDGRNFRIKLTFRF